MKCPKQSWDKDSRRVVIMTSVHTATDVRIFHKEAVTIAGSGYRVSVLGPHPARETKEGIEIIPLEISSGRRTRILGANWAVLRQSLRLRGAIYHFHDPELIPAGLILKIAGKKVIYDVHEDYPKSILTKSYISPWLRRILSLSMSALEWFSSRFWDAIFVVIDPMAVRFPKTRTRVVHNYPLLMPQRESRSPDRLPFTMIYPGVLSKARGLGQILRAMELLPDGFFKLILIGDFPTRKDEAFLRSMKAWRHVEYQGFRPYRDVLSVLYEADLGVECSLPAPNYLFSESNKIFEFMSTGLPVLCSNLPRIRAIVEASACGLCVNPFDENAIAQSIIYFQTHREERIAMGENGRRAVSEHFSWEQEAKTLIQAYEKIGRRRRDFHHA